MRILPGSHRKIARHFERTLKPERKEWTPRHHPLFPLPPERYPTYPVRACVGVIPPIYTTRCGTKRAVICQDRLGTSTPKP
jgi:hypothetical protein